jgi:hypothetical protein
MLKTSLIKQPVPGTFSFLKMFARLFHAEMIASSFETLSTFTGYTARETREHVPAEFK